MKKIAPLALMSSAIALCCAVPALADSYTLNLTPSTVNVVAGSTYTFTGTIVADGGNSGALAPIGITVNGDSPLVFDTDDFYNDTPLTLAAGGNYTGDLFTVTLPADIAAGLYQGSATVELDDQSGNAILEQENFAVNATAAVAATPEPASWLLLSSGLGAVGLLRRRYVRA